MKYIITMIIVLALILLAGYIVIDEQPTEDTNLEVKQSTSIQTFEIKQKPGGFSALAGMMRDTRDARKRNIKYGDIDEEVEKCIKKITKRWKRTYEHRSYEEEYDKEKEEWVITNSFNEKEREFYGYDEGEDFDLRWKLRNRALNGEKIC